MTKEIVRYATVAAMTAALVAVLMSPQVQAATAIPRTTNPDLLHDHCISESLTLTHTHAHFHGAYRQHTHAHTHVIPATCPGP